MGRLSASMIALLLALAAAVGLAACGEDDADLLPGSTAGEITSNLDQVERLADEGDCEGAAAAAEQVSVQVEGLEGVDARLKRALGRGTARLREVVSRCEEATSEEAEEPVIEPQEEEPEEAEEAEKPKDEKPQKEKPESEPGGAEPPESGSLPPQAKGEAKGHDKGGSEGPPTQGGGEPPSGGIEPAAPAGGE